MFKGWSGRGVAASIVVVLAFGIGAVTAGGAKQSLIVRVQLVPGAVSPGQSALAVLTFHNTSSDPLTNVVVRLRFPSAFASVAPPPECTKLAGSALRVSCRLGNVAAGKVAHSYVPAQISKNLTSTQPVNVGFSVKVGPGNPQPLLAAASTQVLASVDAANTGGCQKAPKSLGAVLGAQVTEIPTPPSADPALKLPCTPLAVGVAPKPVGQGFKTSISNADVPKLEKPAVVKLT